MNWTDYFAAQADIRAAYEDKARDIQSKYSRQRIEQPSTDIIEQMARQNRLYAEMIALNDECEAELAQVEKPTAGAKP